MVQFQENTQTDDNAYITNKKQCSSPFYRQSLPTSEVHTMNTAIAK